MTSQDNATVGVPAATTRPSGQDQFFRGLGVPPGSTAVPTFRDGWAAPGGGLDSHLTYVDFTTESWSDDLEGLHEESSRDHFMDILTRNSLLTSIAPTVPTDSVIIDLGCSTGYLLEDLQRRFADAQLVGVDVVAAGLVKAHASVPRAALLLADVCDLPLADASVDAIVSANMLEHVADDAKALSEMLRILKPGGTGAFVVPFGRSLFDYYDRFLGHERRYGKAELADKAAEAGFTVTTVRHLGQYLYPPFWMVKKRNRRLRDRLAGADLEAQVQKDIASTTNSRLGSAACALEVAAGARGLNLPFGIRELVVVTRPMA